MDQAAVCSEGPSQGAGSPLNIAMHRPARAARRALKDARASSWGTLSRATRQLPYEALPQRQETKPAIAQLVEHLTVEIADIRWSLARFRVAGL